MRLPGTRLPSKKLRFDPANLSADATDATRTETRHHLPPEMTVQPDKDDRLARRKNGARSQLRNDAGRTRDAAGSGLFLSKRSPFSSASCRIAML